MWGIFSYAFVVGGCALQALASYDFVPDVTGMQLGKFVDPLPVQYDLAGSQAFKSNISSSYWASSYIYGSDNHQYLAVSHFLSLESGVSVRRSSILDVTNSCFYNQSTTIAGLPSSVSGNTTGVKIKFDDYGFISTTDDPLGSINIYSTDPASIFNITFSLTSPVILNGGQGSFLWETVIANEWSMPKGTTTGSLTSGGKSIAIDPKRSFTWYDRQFQSSGASQWTWFALHTTNSLTKARKSYSIWFSPDGQGGTKGFATVRAQDGVQVVVAANLTTRGSSWLSPHSGNEYATAWTLKLADGSFFNITSIRKDQEMIDSQALTSTYEGFVNVEGEGVSGYGVVEIQPPVSF
ncbi:uncharacterized protein N7496_001531 [Penicillium cataractarum]|uniref:Kievitone hydratase n=1 Tax=Penicillium cataractarum TaxID=2100454 RepID=A0A9W9VWA0_9EURO|nr:uncharacterized protein N7496_001531 [Penicillium cataractarum]KAJ5390463.1 hypothetical protein N7496_001531 [Penicillium cataractarum]